MPYSPTLSSLFGAISVRQGYRVSSSYQLPEYHRVNPKWHDIIYYVSAKMYDVCHKVRNNKKGGGVACYVNKQLASKYIPHKSIVVDNLLQFNSALFSDTPIH